MLDSGNVSIPPFDVASPVFHGVNSHPFGYFVWTASSDKGVYYLATSFPTRFLVGWSQRHIMHN